MPDYKLGKIYQIVSPSHPEVPPYFGSTCQTLSIRMAKHRYKFKQGKGGSNKHLLCFDDAIILLIEDFPCENKEQLNAKEGAVMLAAIARSNKLIAGRTREQYRLDNVDRLKADQVQYRLENADKIKAKDAQYALENADKIKAYKAQYYLEHKK